MEITHNFGHDGGTSKGEPQLVVIMDALQALIAKLTSHGIEPSIIARSLFWWYLRLVVWNRNANERVFESWTERVENVMNAIATELKSFLKEIESSDSTDGSELRETKRVTYLKGTLSREEYGKQTETTMNRLLEFYNLSKNSNISGRILEVSLLYSWIKTSTLDEGLDGNFFCKVQRNWWQAVDRVFGLMDMMVMVTPNG